MTWVKLDDHFFMHPKVMACGPAAAWLWVASIGYANANLTDGFIPAGAVPMLAHATPAKATALAERLVAARLWEADEGGYRIHDYSDWNDSAEEIRSHREHLAKIRGEAGRAGGRQSGVSRAEAKAKQVASTLLEANEAIASKQTMQTRSPSPTPTPTPVPELPKVVPSPPDTSAASDAVADAEPSTPADAAPGARGAQRLDAAEPESGSVAARVAEVLRTDPQLAPIVPRPNELARRLADPDAYPALDVLAEVKRAAAWLAANPSNRKQNGARFLAGWLARAQERAPRRDDGAQLHLARPDAPRGIRPPAPASAFADATREGRPIGRIPGLPPTQNGGTKP